MSAIVAGTTQGSTAEDIGLQSGDEIVAINGQKPRDYIDYGILTKNENIDLHVRYKNGEEEIFEIEKDFDEDLGIIFESAVFDRIKPCTNHCIFCFVDGQPEGFRDTLYIKDDDYRLSYLQGSYVTLTNLTQSDRERIAEQRLAPLYVSVHSMNPETRVKLLRNPKAAKIKEELDFLKENFIPFHAQIVLCPGYNDGEELKFTLDELYKYKSMLLSVAIVPVGVTKYRNDDLTTVSKEKAIETIEIVDEFNKKKKRYPVCVSDEFYWLAEREIPGKKYYGEFSQIEDGVGAVRLLKDDFEKQKKRLPKKLKEPLKLTFALSASAFELFEEFRPELEKIENLEVENVPVKSEFWGEKITVAGLLTSKDIIRTFKGKEPKILVLPGVVFAPYTDNFLDGATLQDIEKALNTTILRIEDYLSFKEITDFLRSKK